MWNQLTQWKKALVHTRLGKRLRDGGFRDFDDYYRFAVM